MKIPFTTEQFLGIFKEYNLTVYPLQVIFNVSAVLCIYFILKNKKSQFSFYFLGFLWMWMGIIYHLIFFTTINKAAFIFGPLFILQGLILLFYSVRRNTLFEFRFGLRQISAILLLIYALAAYPLIGYASGHGYPYAPTFGLPCPTTIFTLGILLLLKGKLPVILVIIPVIWSVIGFNAAISLGIYEDIGLIISGIAVIIFSIRKNPA